MIEVTIVSPDTDIAAQWDDLTLRAPANVFMDPVALKAASDTLFAMVHMLLAWDTDVEPARLVGMWGLQVCRIMPFWPALLEALPYNYSFLSTPVIDPAYLDEAMPAFFAAIRDDPRLPNVVSLKEMDGESPAYAAMLKTIGANGTAHLEIAESRRAFVSRDFGVKNSGSTRKKLRQDWNRLSALGALGLVNERTPHATGEAFEQFLKLEFESWKGKEGTALLCDARDAQFVRRLIGGLADRGRASVALLCLDRKAIAAQVVLYGGPMAYTWKTAYDSGYAKYSPGMLLIDKLTEQLFTLPHVEAIDSCSAGGSFMSQLWSGRKTVIDALIDVGAGWSPEFALEAGRRLGYIRLKGLRDRLRAAAWKAPRHSAKRLGPSQQA